MSENTDPLFDSVYDVLNAAVEWKVRGDDAAGVALLAAVRRYQDDVAAARRWMVPNA